MVPVRTSLTGFSGETIWPLGQLRLLVTIGDANHCTKAWMDFMIVRSISPYNGIIGRPSIKEIQAVPSTAQRILKFPADRGIVTIRSTILIPAECATVITSPKEIPKEIRTSHQNLKVAIHPNFPDQEVAIGGTLSLARSEHRLNIRKGYSPVRQKKRGQALERAKAIQAEVQKLIAAGIMREVYYHDWLSNPIMVKKHDGSWRMCVDFTDLNKACPQDCYPLPEFDWKIESLYGYPLKCFLDSYKGYHQIQMAELDEEKMAFHTSQGVYCYTKMPSGLKNAGATYQRLVDKAFDSQVGPNKEVYVDDLVIKSHTEAEMLRDINETFRMLQKINMKLNPKKYTFEAVEGMFLGYTITLEGIKPCPDKTEAVLQLPSHGRSKRSRASTGSWLFTASSNEAEYEALIAGLRIATQMGVQNVQVNMDSKMVANQVLGTYIAKEENMIKYLEKFKGLVSGFANFSISQVPRSKNKKEDALSKITSTSFAHLSKQVLVEVLQEKSIQEKEVTTVVEEDGSTWMTPIIEYLKDGILPGDRKEAIKVALDQLQAMLRIREIHKGSCSMHAGPRSVVAKAMRLGYYWPTMHRDAIDMIRACNNCQVKKFVWDNIVCRFGLPREIISDNDKQFSDNPFKDWCDKLNITQRFASVKHPQSNGLVERVNRSLGEGIKARLGEGNKNWLEELPHVLWAHRTMIKSSHGDTPFSLTYGMKAVIPAEIGMPTYRTATVDTVHNDKEMRLNLDLLEEKRERAAICEAKSKMAKMR
ncbi:reverse transcriptase domain-containing protein [Tanacetum coccineum]|uniref:Reverse transcriptase domain-containing protein n=1 Tax=Tanacetum coccineum TaxID=301880 RepID=A0ABQ5F7B8_9ASTR